MGALAVADETPGRLVRNPEPRRPADPGEGIVNAIWARRLAWSEAADRLDRNISRARAAVLLLCCAGAVLETLAATGLDSLPDLRTGTAVAGSICLGLATYVAAQWVSGEAMRAWTVTRSVSEALKAEIFRFRARCGSYAEADRFSRLNAAVVAIEEGGADYEAQLAAIPPSGSPAPGELDEQAYIARRVTAQASGYFRPAAARHAREANLLRHAVVICGISGAALSAGAAYLSAAGSSLDLAAWVAVLTTIGTALTAHMTGRRYDFLILSYLKTARRLESLANEWASRTGPSDQQAWNDFVRRCEDAIAATNESWVAKFAAPSG